MAGYPEIAEHYRDKIHRGEMRPGERMPTLQNTMETWGVSMKTAARAYGVLKMEGLTQADSRGTWVALSSSSNTSNRLDVYAATGKALGLGEISQILEIGAVGADETVASRLEVAPGTPVHLRRRVVSRDGVPVHVSTSYYPAFVFAVTPELGDPTSTGGSRELAAERLGVAQDRVLEEVTSRFALPWEKKALGLTGQVIATQVVRTVSLVDGRVVEVAVKVCHGSTVLKWSSPLGTTPRSDP
jgi:GntR family transcriptional regulator